MKKLIVLLIVLSIFAINSTAMADDFYIDDGGSLTIDHATWQNDRLWFDYDIYTAPNPGTHVDLVTNGVVYDLRTYNNSSLDISGGTIRDDLRTYGNSTAKISSGSVNFIHAWANSDIEITGGTIGDTVNTWDNSTVKISNGLIGDNFQLQHNSTVYFSGGSIAGNLQGWGDAVINISGGSVEEYLRGNHNSTINMLGGSVNHLAAYNDTMVYLSGGSVGGSFNAHDDSIIYLDGSGFAITIDGVTTSLSNGDMLSDFGKLIDGGSLVYYTGIITGTLADGSALNDEFTIFNMGSFEGTADIIIIPEPCSLVLLSLGGLMLRRRKT